MNILSEIGSSPPWYFDFIKTQGIAVFILLGVAFWMWKVYIPSLKKDKEEARADKLESDRRLMDQIKEGKEQVLRSENRNQAITDKFVDSLADVAQTSRDIAQTMRTGQDKLNEATERNVQALKDLAAKMK